MTGQITPFLVDPSTVITGHLPLAGGTYIQADYPALSAVLPASLKDDTAGTFTLPNASGRTLIGGVPGSTGGSNSVALTEAQLPAHAHGITASGQAHASSLAGTTSVPGGAYAANTVGLDREYTNDATRLDSLMAPIAISFSVSSAGSNAPINITPAYVGVMLYIEC